jgi:hypothetical protein
MSISGEKYEAKVEIEKVFLIFYSFIALPWCNIFEIFLCEFEMNWNEHYWISGVFL